VLFWIVGLSLKHGVPCLPLAVHAAEHQLRLEIMLFWIVGLSLKHGVPCLPLAVHAAEHQPRLGSSVDAGHAFAVALWVLGVPCGAGPPLCRHAPAHQLASNASREPCSRECGVALCVCLFVWCMFVPNLNAHVPIADSCAKPVFALPL
jgi:hypothetical protein